MPEICLICKGNQSPVINVREQQDLQPILIAEYPEILNVPNNEPIYICADCIEKTNRCSNTIEVSGGTESESIGGAKEPVNIENNSKSQSVFMSLEELESLHNSDKLRRFTNNDESRMQKILQILNQRMPKVEKEKRIKKIMSNNQDDDDNNNSRDERALLDESSIHIGSKKIMEIIMDTSDLRPNRTARTSPNGSSNSTPSNSLVADPVISHSLQTSSQENQLLPSTPIINSRSLRVARIFQNDYSSVSRSPSPATKRLATSSTRSNNDDHSNLAAPRRTRSPDGPRPMNRKNMGG